jgi:hypothetical protein
VTGDLGRPRRANVSDHHPAAVPADVDNLARELVREPVLVALERDQRHRVRRRGTPSAAVSGKAGTGGSHCSSPASISAEPGRSPGAAGC